MKGSYPYLEIARQIGADYGDILSYSDLLDATKRGARPQAASFWQKRASLVLHEEQKLAVIATRGDEHRRRTRVQSAT